MSTVEITMLGRFEVAVDSVPVPARLWSRRHAAALVKVLALAPGRRLRREQVIDLVWPDEPVEDAVPKLHKAAHFARRAIGVPGAVVLRVDLVLLCPDIGTTVDVARFSELAGRALELRDVDAARVALSCCGGELLPDDRYEAWAEEPRDHLRRRRLDLLRLAERWAEVVELEPGDEPAHLALMRRHAANGDRHAALRQFERMSRVLRRELGVAPGREAVALRDRLLAEHDVPRGRDDPLVGRDAELAAVERALAGAAAGRSRVLIVAGAAGVGKSALVAAAARRARAAGFRIAQGTSAPIEGAWPYAPVLEALADLCRRHPALLDRLPAAHRGELDRVLVGAEASWGGAGSHQRLFVAAAELVRLAAAPRGLVLTVDDVHDADDASLRLLHYIARSTYDRQVCLVLTHRRAPMSDTLVETRRSLLDRHEATAIDLGPLDAADVRALVRRHVPDASSDLVERIAVLGRGIPFAVLELARRSRLGRQRAQALDTDLIADVPSATREMLQRVAVLGSSFDTDEFVALSGVSEAEAWEHLDTALAALVVEPASAGYRFRHDLLRDALLADLPAHRRRRLHAVAAAHLVDLRASPARIGHHLLASGAAADAVPYLLRAAETEAAVGAYRDALAVTDTVRRHATGAHRAAVLSLRGDLLNALGDPAAVSAYRAALAEAEPGAARRLRVRLARSAVMCGDVATAAAALEGLDTDGGPDDADILLTRAKCAYFGSDFDTAQAAADEAQKLVLGGEHDWKVLDLVSLQGLLAHRSGGWFDRMRLELRQTRENPEVAHSVFDGYLCTAEYMLYGPTPYPEVIELARALQATATRSGALRAAAFAGALVGEAALLSGDLRLAATELAQACELHRQIGSGAGEAHSLQRLAEVRVAEGDRDAAAALLERALLLARGSILARHLLHRVFGTMIAAAPDPLAARAVVDRAESALGWDDLCPFCSIMLSVPAAIACGRAGDLDGARRHLAAAQQSVAPWEGTAWEAGTVEAQAVVAAAGGDPAAAEALMCEAARRFRAAGQPLDTARCEAAAIAYRAAATPDGGSAAAAAAPGHRVPGPGGGLQA